MTLLRHYLSNDDGAAAVEFGLVLPFLAMVLFGIIEFGLMFNAQLTLQHATREGVRVLSITKDSAKAVAATKAAAQQLSSTPTVTTTACVHGVQTSVTAQHTYSYLTPMFGALFGSSTRTMSATGVMRCGG